MSNTHVLGVGKLNKHDVNVLELRKLVEDGFNNREIGEMLYISPSTVQRRLQQYGIKREDKAFIRDMESYIRMKNCGLNDEQVAYVWGISRRKLYNWKKENNIINVCVQTNGRLNSKRKVITRNTEN